MTRRGRRTALAVLASAVALVVGAAYAGAAALRVPPPHDLVRLQAHEPSEQGGDFAARPVVSSGPARPLEAAADAGLPATVPWKGGRITPQEMLDETHTRAFVVLHDGRLVHEWYAEGVDAGTRLSSWSVAKSVVSLLIGQAIERGILSEDDRMTDLLPELRTGDAYDDITVHDLLDMASGIDVSENYNPWWPFTGTARLLLSTDLPGYVAEHREVSFAPGTRGEYRSIDTQMLSMILTRVDGRPLAQIVAEDLWTPMGAEADASWNLDREGGVEKGFCCLNATARDFARLGRLVLDGGRVGDAQVVPEAWIARISTPGELPVDGWGYSAQWWHAPSSDGDVTALGVYGQYVFVAPDARTVIVKLSDHGTEQDELETIDAMRAIADHLAGR
ncbi:serine hydrolase domain-containing protein [Microbacterium sp. No. 7]|uniref:serine hydrolase domain-containing protein n=1 Tax=Microbacterium sp. No. 7 TaxID=1714373 RepID=UPI0006D13E89|nr:serine hydrolase [Microbacterium sp. No. 7]ALJ20471.1 serine hydrolase [Microbacterium sp. No. 7]